MDGFVSHQRRVPYISRAPVTEQQRGNLRVVAIRPAIDSMKVAKEKEQQAISVGVERISVSAMTYPKTIKPVAMIPKTHHQQLGGYYPSVSPKPLKIVAATQTASISPAADVYPSELEEQPLHEVKQIQPRRLRRRTLRLKREKKLRKTSVRASVTYALAIIMVVAGGVVTVQGALLNQQLREQVKVLSASTKSQDTSSGDSAQVSETAGPTDIPSESKPKANYLDTYRVSPDLPRLISIPRLNVRARVLQVGIDSKNELLTPKSIYDTAWYTGSVKPGELGTAVIDGHYVGPTTNGVFSHINNLKNGDIVMVERGDGVKLTFRVIATETVPVENVDMMKVVAPNDKQAAKLNLITCGGRYDAKTFHYSDRTVVYTVLEA